LSALPDVVCFSHLRWNFVFQRPQHLLSRYVRSARVFYVEEPIVDGGAAPWLDVTTQGGVDVVVPRLPAGLSPAQTTDALRVLVDELWTGRQIDRPLLWYYTPMALAFTDHLSPTAGIVYDCMDELSAFKDAAPELREYEARLVNASALVFTGGASLFEAKRLQYRHDNLHLFPSSVDARHFAQARQRLDDPADQAAIPHPRLGFFGVLDERLDIALLRDAAALRPEWQFILVGPVVKIAPDLLPRAANLHYLGPKPYEQLPQYLGGWDVALLLFARNEATRFISPTKTPEYLAAGRAVVSTSIRDVVRPYGELGLAHIADDAEAFVRACERALADDPEPRLAAADAFLRTTSWDVTWARMRSLIQQVAHPTRDRAAAGEIAV
jgi:UDP-galactopyranose mutase